MYRLTERPDMVLRVEDGTQIPAGHRWWDEYQAWLAEGNTPEPVAAESARQVQVRLTAALNSHLNAVAGERSYDDRFTCSLRAGYPGPFQSEGQTFADWMDNCNMVAYQIMAEVKQGLRPIPTEAELIDAMPVIVWPPSPVPEGAA